MRELGRIGHREALAICFSGKLAQARDSRSGGEGNWPEEITPSRGVKLLLTRHRLAHWGRQSAISLIDQGLTSAASFGLNVILAHWLAPED